jgi:hypothetical protein
MGAGADLFLDSAAEVTRRLPPPGFFPCPFPSSAPLLRTNQGARCLRRSG